MGKDRDRHKTEYDLDQLLRESFGVDDKTLLERFNRAQTEIDDSQIPPEQEDGFQRLLDKIEEKGIEPQSVRNSEPEKKTKKRRLKPMLKVALVAAIVVVMMLATTITAGAKKYFSYRRTVRASVRNDVVLDNDRNMDYEGRLEKAYIEIEEKIGISVVQLEDMPSDMVYLKTDIIDSAATMTFKYKDNIFYVVQQIKDATNSINIISDRREKDEVHNKWINQDIEIQKTNLDSGDVEYSAEFTKGNSSYYLAGVMGRDDFVKIIKNLYIEEGDK